MDRQGIERWFRWGESEGLEVYRLGGDETVSLLRVGPCLVIYHVGPRPDPKALVDLLPWTPRRLFFKERQRQEARRQYRPEPQNSDGFWVQEDGMRFWVDPGMYHDIGLFADQRNARRRLRSQSSGSTVLNLFCYTGAFSIACARGGARRVLNVDLSETYLNWARRNWAANRLEGTEVVWLRRDALEWVRSEPGVRFDLIVVDPPVFSVSKRMRQDWDVRRDHGWFLLACRRLLKPGGTLYFSTHARGFSLDPALVRGGGWRNITEEIRAPDFPEDGLVAYIYDNQEGVR